MNRKYAVVDIETTGNNLDSDEIIQIGIAIVQNKKIIKTYDTFIACNNEIPAFIQSLTKIDAFDLIDAPDFSNVASQIIQLLDGCVFVAHNVQFDLRFLQKYFNDTGFTFQPRYIVDTVDWFKIIYPSLERYQLKSIADDLGIELSSAHRAIDDAIATAEVLIESIKKVATFPPDTIKMLYQIAKRMRYSIDELLFEILVSQTEVHHFDSWNGLYYYKSTKKNPRLNPFEEDYRTYFEQAIRQLGYTFREKQYELSEQIYRQLREDSVLTIEADLGGGKTTSYLLAAIYYLSSCKQSLLISTSTIFLQNQLINEDLSRIEQALQITVPYQIIKSRRHYLSLEFVTFILEDPKENHDILLLKMQLIVYLLEPFGGDIDRLNLNGGRKIYFELMSSMFDSALHQHYSYQDANETQHIGITNHAHLLSRRKDNIFNHYEHLIVDEAHQLLDYALNNSYDTLNYQTIKYIIGQTIKSVPDNPSNSLNTPVDLDFEISQLNHKIDDLFDHLLNNYLSKSVVKVTVQENDDIYILFKEIHSMMNDLLAYDMDASIRTKLETVQRYFLSVWIQIKVYKELYIHMKNNNKSGMSLLSKSIKLNDILTNRIFDRFKSKVFISGTMQTLSFLEQFHPSLDNFYKYENTFSKYKATLFVPSDIQDYHYMKQEQYIESCLQYIHYYLENVSSKVLILMNSYRQIEILRSYLVELYDPSLIITQTSDVNTMKLNEQFNMLDNGIFLATQTFYEGVDFKYDGFKTVMIISLPFMHPDDLNIMLMRDEVNDVFMDYQLPGAVNKLHQATGRLIRNEQDRGMIICFDRRLLEGRFASHFSHILKSFHVKSGTIEDFTDIIEQINQEK
ncbi:hypothetical protein ETI05_02660 [Macrococcoides canis]|uniref:3'-5' exonuclease DinG n=1 Tax=Macrococcoides canis TaxID=1855823 RepID=A0A4R6C771_9STAP|nr:helicase C-terminal domain-containing protein [Macrococcus canis]TDM18294.1 hypothetical protein ETI04_02045 [Macrococcus canis]TDM21661.1 hypothetical protein ETI05_02660 [Macrococcus canis]TDM23453.1 hypothetical protein ETI02_03370 [Macrococcus canis]TDM38244.1 hypothetical protein ETI11_02295 [Macrococcus canis]